MNKKDLVSIIVPIYNKETRIEKCINSLIHQTYKNIEIILIDDGSNDNSLNICKKYATFDRRIVLKTQKNSGVSSARNTGINISNGKYIFFLDGDDYLDLDLIEKLVIKIKNVDCVKASYKRIIDSKGKKSNVYDKMNSQSFIKLILENKEDGYCWGVLFRRSILKKNNLYFDISTSYMEDTLFLIKYLLFIKDIDFIDDSFYNYIDSSDGISSPINNIKIKLINAFYSLDCIKKILSNTGIYSFELLNLYIYQKKVVIYEYLIQNLNYKDLKEILSSYLTNEICDFELNKSNLKLRQKIFLYLLHLKSVYIILCYIKIKNIMKRVKRLLI